MNIAFLTSEYPSSRTSGSGGIATSIKNLASGMVADGKHPVVLVYSQDEDEVFEDDGIKIYKIKNVKFKGVSLFLTQNKIRKLIDKLYDQGIIEVVEAPDWCGITAFIQPEKCKVVIKLHGSDTYFCSIENRPSKWKNRFLEGRALRKADGIISVSQFTADYTAQLFQLSTPIEVIPNGVAVDVFVPSTTQQDPNLILYFGTLIRKKGCLEIPKIFNIVFESNPNAKLLLIGSDSPDIHTHTSSTWSLMKTMFNEKPLAHVTYLGRKPYHEIKDYINQARVCIFPSFAEALPVSWIEAMAMEKAIVASNIGWAPELIDHGKEGVLVHPNDHLEFAAAINQLLSDTTENFNLGKAARAKVLSKFSNTQIVLKHNLFYSK